MYKVSEKYKDFLENSLGLSPKSKIIVDGVTYDGKFIKETPKFNHQNDSMFGGFPTKTCSFEIYDLNNELDFVNKEIAVYRGLVIDEEIEWVPQGIFIATEDKITTNISKKTVSFKDSQDKTQLFDSKYESSLDWSVEHTGLEIIQEMCDKLGVELESTAFNLADYSFKQPNFNESITNRQVVSSFAEIAGSIAFLNREGRLAIRTSVSTNQIIPRKRYTNLTKEKEFIINTLVLGKEGMDDDIVYPETISSERKEWKIFDNPFVDLYRQEMIEELSNNFIGKSIIPFELEDFVDGFLFDLNDEITIVDKNGNTFKTILLSYESTSRIKSKVSAATQTENKTDYTLAGSNKSNYNDIKLSVDHINKQIQAHAESIEKNTKSVNELEKSVNLFNAYLSQENLIISTDATKKPLETKNYEIVVESYFKGELVSPSITIDGNNEGITAKVETGKIVIDVDSSTVIANTNNDYSVEILYMDGNTKYTSNKKLTVSLALAGTPGKDGAKGDKGDDGTPGKDGENGKNGTSSYTHIRYSQNANGDGMTTEATDAIYIGIAITTSATAPTSPSAYNWSKIKGDDGERGIDGTPGTNGTNGKDGTSSYLHIRWSEDGKTFSKPNLNNKKLVSGFITTAGAFEEKSSTYPNSKYFEPFILKNGDTINIELPSSKDFRLRLFETDDRWITTVSLNGKEVSYKNSRGRDVKVYILFYSGISQEDADQVIFYKQSEIGKQPARYQGTYVDTNPTDSENFDDYNWVDTAIVVNEVIEEVKTNVADLEIGLDHVTTTVSESIETTNDIENRLTAVEQTASGLDIKVSENQQKLDNLNGTNNRLKNLEDSNSKLKTNLETMQGTIEMMNFNFRTDGLHIGSDGVDVNSKLDNQGLRIYNVSTLISIFNKNGSGFEKLIVTESIQFQNLKLLARTIDTPTKSGRKVVSGFWVDELIETLEDLED